MIDMVTIWSLITGTILDPHRAQIHIPSRGKHLADSLPFGRTDFTSKLFEG